MGACRAWAFGYVVRRRTDDARRAIVEADELATFDPAERAAQVVAEERARLAGEVVRVVRAGVTAMQRHAAAAEADLDRVALESVQEEGRRAVAELRRLLGLLRADEPPAAVREPTPRRRWPLDVAVTGGLAGLFMLEFHFGLGPLSWGSAAAGLVAVGAVAVRRIEPMLACLVALVAVALAGVLGQPFPHVVTTAAGFVLLAWSVAVRARWRAYAALGALTVVVAADVYRSEPANVVITLAAFALGGLAGHTCGRPPTAEAGTPPRRLRPCAPSAMPWRHGRCRRSGCAWRGSCTMSPATLSVSWSCRPGRPGPCVPSTRTGHERRCARCGRRRSRRCANSTSWRGC